MYKKLLLSIAICFLLFAKKNYSQLPDWVSFTSDLGTRSICIEGVNLWATTDNGLIKIDTVTGVKTVYDNLNGFNYDILMQVIPATNGGVWVGTREQGLIHFDGITATQFLTTSTADTMRYIYDQKYDNAGNLWFYSLLGSSYTKCIVKYDGVNFTSFDITGICNSILFGWTNFDIDNNDNIWMVTDCGVTKFDGVNFTQFDSLNSAFQYSKMVYIVKDQSGVLWTSDDHYLYSYNGSNWTMHSDSFSVAAANMERGYADLTGGIFFINGCCILTKDIAGNWNAPTQFFPNSPGFMSVNAVVFDYPGSYWLGSGTQQPGYKVIHWQGNSYTTYNIAKSGLMQYAPLEITFDRHNEKYIGGTGMISRFDGLNWDSIMPATQWIFSINSLKCSDLAFDKYHNLWISNNGSYLIPEAGVVKYNGQDWIKYPLKDVVSDLCLQNNEIPWIISNDSTRLAYMNNNVWNWVDTSATHIAIPNFLAEDLSHNIWVTSWNDGVSKFDGTNWTSFTMNNSSIPDSSLYFPVTDSSGNMWFASYTRLVKYDGTNWSSVALPVGVTNIYEMTYGKNAIWLATNLGLFTYNGTFSFIPYPLTNFSQISDLEFDRSDNLWIVKSRGVYVYNSDGVDVNTIIASHNANIQGECYYDVNNNAQRDTLEPGWLPNQKVILSPDSAMNISFPNGGFVINCDSGSHVLSVIPTAHWSISTDSLTYTILSDTSDLCCYDFGFKTDQLFDSVSISINAITIPRCNSNAIYYVEVINQGTNIFNGVVTVELDSTLDYVFSNVTPVNVNGNTIQFNIVDLYPMSRWNAKLYVVNPPVQSQALICTALVTSSTFSALDVFDETVVCSFDPNDKTAKPTGDGIQHLTPMDESINYTIRFENLGSDTAFTIHVIDSLDSSFDLSTFLLVASSHPVSVNFSDNLVDFDFHNILLPQHSIDSVNSQGFVKYRISPKIGLPNNTIVKNKAFIYFDFNSAVETNETFNTLSYSLVSVNRPEHNINGARIYPVPATESITIQAESESGYFNLYDYTGRMQKSITIHSLKTYLPVKDLSPGIYFYKYLNSDSKQISSGKLIIAK